jgi:hypothetical protein
LGSVVGIVHTKFSHMTVIPCPHHHFIGYEQFELIYLTYADNKPLEPLTWLRVPLGKAQFICTHLNPN